MSKLMVALTETDFARVLLALALRIEDLRDEGSAWADSRAHFYEALRNDLIDQIEG